MRFTIFMMLFFLGAQSHARILQSSPQSLTVGVYEGGSLEKPFKVIGRISVTTANSADLVRVISKQARKLGGDAVLDYRVISYGGPQVGSVMDDKGKPLYGIGSLSYASAEGVVVEYVKSDGVLSLDDAKNIPVLP